MNFFNNRTKNDTIDPLSCVVKLYILTFKGAGSKIAFYNNCLNIDPPGYFQGTARKLSGGVKSDVTMLTMPILYACNKYLMIDKTKYLFLFTKTIEALQILKQTYEGDEIIHNIDSIIGIIQDFIDGNTTIVNSSYNTDGGKLKRAIYESISQVWTEERLAILFNLIEQIGTNKTHIGTIVQALENFMRFIDELVHDIIAGLK